MGRGSNTQALHAKGLLYGRRRTESVKPLDLTPASMFTLLCKHKQLPGFILNEFPDCEIVDVKEWTLPDDESGHDAQVDLRGINQDRDKRLGIFTTDHQSVYYLDESRPISESPPEFMLPGNDAEQRLLRCLAAHSARGQEVEIVVYNQAQAESLLDNYGDKDLRLTSPEPPGISGEAAALDQIYDHHPLLDEGGLDRLSNIKTLQELLAQSGGREVLTSYFQGDRNLHFLISLDSFRVR